MYSNDKYLSMCFLKELFILFLRFLKVSKKWPFCMSREGFEIWNRNVQLVSTSACSLSQGNCVLLIFFVYFPEVLLELHSCGISSLYIMLQLTCDFYFIYISKDGFLFQFCCSPSVCIDFPWQRKTYQWEMNNYTLGLPSNPVTVSALGYALFPCYFLLQC